MVAHFGVALRHSRWAYWSKSTLGPMVHWAGGTAAGDGDGRSDAGVAGTLDATLLPMDDTDTPLLLLLRVNFPALQVLK